MVACETCWNNATERTLPVDPTIIPDDPAPPRGRSRSVSSNTADATKIKKVASHNRRTRLIIQESGRGNFVHQPKARTGLVTTPVGSTSQLDSSRAAVSSLPIRERGRK
jgi:hypothetical protein